MQLMDWEKIVGIEGLILANQVINIDFLVRNDAKDVPQFAENPVNIQSLTSKPASHTSKITATELYAREGQHFIVSTLDFANCRDCVLDKDYAEKSDFEKWSPFTGENDRCTLGKE
ncbi:hypothetical protein BGX34_004610, partial [Mortierella sp. NVP85]